MALITDKFAHVGLPGTVTSLQSPGKAIGAASINIGSAANWVSDGEIVYFAIRTVNPSNITTTNPSGLVAGTYTEWKGIKTGTTIASLTLKYGTDQVYTAGTNTQVYIVVSASQMNDLVDGIKTSLNPDGSLIPAAVKTALGITSNTTGGWDILNGSTAPTVSSGYNKGNKEFALTFAGVDLTSTLSAGMRLKFDRSTAAPTQCMGFTAASSQYATKASPSGITFTTAFTCEAWVYLNSYQGANQAIVTRSDGTTGGFYLGVTSSGQPYVGYAGSSSFTTVTAYQSVPLKRWVHIAGVVSSVSGKTAALYINGVSIPVQAANPSAATTLTQTGSLQVGGFNSGQFFDGQIAEARIWSTAQTQTQIQDNMAISLAGNETNLVALFQGNGNFTDKTANANTLTATGGAIATFADNPYHTTEYAIITKNPTYATSNTTVTVFTGTDYVIPNATLQNPYSSYQRTPFGFPSSRSKWMADAVFLSQLTGGYSGVSSWVALNMALTVPSGEWNLGYMLNAEQTSTVSGARDGLWRLSSTVPSGNTQQEYTSYVYSGAGTAVIQNITRTRPQSLSTPTTFSIYTMIQSATGSENWFVRNEIGIGIISAECAYI